MPSSARMQRRLLCEGTIWHNCWHVIWRFPEMGVPPNHPFSWYFHGIFLYKQSILGIPIYGNPMKSPVQHISTMVLSVSPPWRVRMHSSCCTATSSTGRRSPCSSPAKRWSPCATSSPLREMRGKIPGGPPRRTWIRVCLPDLRAMRHFAWSWVILRILECELMGNMIIFGWARPSLRLSMGDMWSKGADWKRNWHLLINILMQSIRLISGMSSGLIFRSLGLHPYVGNSRTSTHLVPFTAFDLTATTIWLLQWLSAHLKQFFFLSSLWPIPQRRIWPAKLGPAPRCRWVGALWWLRPQQQRPWRRPCRGEPPWQLPGVMQKRFEMCAKRCNGIGSPPRASTMMIVTSEM